MSDISTESRTTLSEIKSQLNASPASALAFIMKEGRIHKGEFRCGDVMGNAGSSFSFNVEKLTGADFSDSGRRGYKGVFDVYVAHAQGDTVAAIKLAREYLGLAQGDRPVPKIESLARPSDKGEWKAITPVPESAGMPDFRRMTPKGAKAVAAWPYRDEAGRTLFHVFRYELADGKKVTPQVSYGHNDDPALRWKMKGAGLKTLYGREQLARRPDAPVLVVEGEKAAVAGRRMMPDHVVVTWVGGANNVQHIDFGPLAGRRVTFLADADQPGELAMRQAEKRARKAGVFSSRVIVLPPEFGASRKGWDVADPLPPGWTVERLKGLIAGAQAERRFDIERHARGIVDSYQALGPRIGGKAALERTTGEWSSRIAETTGVTVDRARGFVEATLKNYVAHRRAGLSQDEARDAAAVDMRDRLREDARERSGRFQERERSGLSL